MFTWVGMLEASVVGAICIVLFFLFSRLWGERYRAGYRKVIWLLIALRMCIPVSTSFFQKPVTVQVPVYVFGETRQAALTDAVPQDGGNAAGVEQMVLWGQTSRTNQTGQPVQAAPVFAGGQFTSGHLLVIVWSLGCMAVLGFYLSAHFIFCHKMMKRSEACRDRRILEIAAESAGKIGLKKIPQVRLTKDTQAGPFTTGFFHNIIFLPDREYQERDLQYIIRHELTHCKGMDTRIKTLLMIVNAIHWFNPFAWFMKALADQDMELACDEKVLANTSREERSEYGEVLMSCIGTGRAGTPALSTGYVQGVKFIKKRFHNIFHMQKKSGKAAGCAMAALLIMVSAGLGFEAGRTVYARGGIRIDCGIELRVDVTGDGQPDQIRVYDDNDVLRTSVTMNTADGWQAQFDYMEELWSTSYLVSGDLNGNGVSDIVLMRVGFGMHLVGPVSVLYVEEEAGKFIWREYPENFIPNPAVEREQPETFEDIGCLGATVIEENSRHYLRLIALDEEYLAETFGDDDQVLCIDCSWQGDGWFIEKMQTIEGYYSENKEDELLKNNIYHAQ